jgi:hypothetical protein
MVNSATLNSEQYNDLLKCLTNLAEACTDADIRDGMIRQRSTSNTTVFEISLNSLIDDLSIPLINLKNKLILLKTFAGQDVTIETVDDGFIFSDFYSTLKILNPAVEFMDNKCIPPEELERIFDTDSSELMMECELPSSLTERIKIITNAFSSPAIQAFFTGETAALCSNTTSGDQYATFLKNIPLNVEIDKAYLNIPIIPFSIEHDTDVNFQMFKAPGQDIAICKFSTTLGDIDINIFSRNSIMFK